jgi:hypothetical protein
MTTGTISAQLQRIASADDFSALSAELAEAWSTSGAAVDTVDPILQFMEQHPDLDFGMPGALVHFVERFFGKGYEGKLVESIQRKPTSTTVWMLNRVINGTKSPDAKQWLIAVMKGAAQNPATDQQTRQLVSHFLARLSA